MVRPEIKFFKLADQFHDQSLKITDLYQNFCRLQLLELFVLHAVIPYVNSLNKLNFNSIWIQKVCQFFTSQNNSSNIFWITNHSPIHFTRFQFVSKKLVQKLFQKN
ncbi:hypothetical protein BpHYR1_010881 [Brachionus plicatilis]|uniref:Uncharacterized protein n=1 Tax=Brachionus plicatilis TaxID=10195 RepID=A0A3M7PW53_BRAPC|nr:hypothetical protein BpHYR1_010881 [Brachionus plicatilis]